MSIPSQENTVDPKTYTKLANLDQVKQARIDKLVQNAIATDSVQAVFELVTLFAKLNTGEYAECKSKLKQHFKNRLPITSLDKEVKKQINRNRAKRSQLPENDKIRPAIEVGGHLRDIRRDALLALVAFNRKDPCIFVQSGRLVTIHSDEKKVPCIVELSETRLRALMSESADYFTAKHIDDDIIKTPVFPPIDVVKSILHGMDGKDYPFPALTGITELPIIRDDGTICQQPGYDTTTGYVYIPGTLLVPDVPTQPTKQDVEQALNKLNEWFMDFPFVDNASRAAILAMAITVVIRHVIRGQVPLCLMDAPKQGTGKSIVAMAIGILATGKATPPQPPTQDEEEMRKRLLTWLQQTPSVILIDNVNFVLESSALNTALTSPTFGDRLLSTNTNITVENRAVWFATGNNIRTGDDTARRCIKCRMDAKVERPHKRDINAFHIPGGVNGFFQWTINNRPELIAACLTLFRYWHVQGRIKPDVAPIGSFEDWSIILGGILQAAGVPDFLANLDENGSSAMDDISAEWSAFFEGIHEALGEKPFTLQALAKEMLTDGDEALNNLLPGSLSKSYGAFRKSDGIDRDFAKHMGYAFRTRRDQIYNGYTLMQAGMDRKKNALWQVVKENEKRVDQINSHSSLKDNTPSIPQIPTQAPINDTTATTEPAILVSTRVLEVIDAATNQSIGMRWDEELGTIVVAHAAPDMMDHYINIIDQLSIDDWQQLAQYLRIHPTYNPYWVPLVEGEDMEEVII